MYALSTEAKKDLQSYTISGSIGQQAGAVGSYLFDDENILKGSLAIANQCSDSSAFNLGGVYIGQMSCTFIGLSIPRNGWVGQEISLEVTINGVQTIPVGKFYVDKAEHTKGMVKITAYDGMIKFDKALDSNTATLNDSPYNILNWICSQCGVNLGMTQAQVEALPNGADPFFVTRMGDIETYRDVLYWLSQTLGGFATMDRNGALVIRSYHNSVDDVIDYNVRFNISQYGDEIIKYSGFYWTNEEDGTAEYEHAIPDDYYYVSLGINPFFQSGLRNLYVDGILDALGNIEYNPCDVTIPFGIQYDLGDVLRFPNGQGSASNKFCIMSYSWTYYGGYRIKSIAVPKTSKNKSDKNITALMRKSSSDKIVYYLITNISDIDVGDNEEKTIVDLYFAAEKSTVVVFDVEMHCDVETTVNGNDFYDAVAKFTYYLNNEKIDNFEPIETWFDGNHIKHLLYHFTIQDAGTKRLQVKLFMSGGSVHIDMNNLKGAIYGQNLAASDQWNGIIKIEETAPAFNLEEIQIAEVEDSLAVGTKIPTKSDLSDPVVSFNLVEISIASANERIVDVQTRINSYAIITETGDNIITEQGDSIYTEGV